MKQFIKFLATGGINTFVDFAVLNALILGFGLVQGDPKYMYFKAVSYIVASCNSFVLNKWWVFKSTKERAAAEALPFAIVNILGLVVNTTVSLFVFHGAASLLPQLGTQVLANLGAVTGTVVVLLFNFIAYKFFIFKKK